MCDVKKLCTCETVLDGQDHWRLECHYGSFPSWGHVVETRPEHHEMAMQAAERSKGIMGPMPMPQFHELHHGLADRSQMQKVVEVEEAWLNAGNQFDFPYEPFQGDRLMFCIGGEEIAFSYMEGHWIHKPHQAYSVDDRFDIDA
jgi:hypothetical protein